MRSSRLILCFAVLVLVVASPVWARLKRPPASDPQQQAQQAAAAAIADKVFYQEAKLVQDMHKFTPMVETYIQDLKTDKELGAPEPASDAYFVGRLNLDERGLSNIGYDNKSKRFGVLGSRLTDRLTGFFKMQYLPLGFMQLLMLNNNFDKDHYELTFERRQFLGEVRTLVFNVKAKPHFKGPHFLGRIYVEENDYHIVRFNGTFEPQSRGNFFFHFDSWRMNLQADMWLPAFVYTEESDTKYMMFRHLAMKGQTRLWGYDRKHSGRSDELTSIQVDQNDQVSDRTEKAMNDYSPVQSQHLWEREAEDNVLERMERAGLLAPDGQVSKVLQTVINNIEVTNDLDLTPEVRCRVLLTTPLETFTVGHTIVISRGLLDVLPDEASLAMVLSHELAHIALGHRLDTKYSFSDRVLFKDEESFRKIRMNRDPQEEEKADAKAVEFLKKSPYNDKLATAALFLRVLQDHSSELPSLISPHFGNSMAAKKDIVRMGSLKQSAPPIEKANMKQLAALPLGSRIKLDPWDDHVDMKQINSVPLQSARDKMPFEVTPVIVDLARFSGASQQQNAAVTPETRNPDSAPAEQ